MSDSNSRFTPQNQTTTQRLSTNTVGLVALSDFRKRRAEVLEQQEREAREQAVSGTSTPDRSLTGTPDNAGSDSGINQAGNERPLKKKKKKKGKKLLSFDDGDEEDDASTTTPKSEKNGEPTDKENGKGEEGGRKKGGFKANAAVGIIPKAVTKSALRKEATEREALRREYITLQELIKATEIAIPFVFYDGTDTPGGIVRVKKGDFVWVMLDKSRKVGAEVASDKASGQRAWARVGVDDLMLVRGTVIIPHHYDFYYFIMNKSVGPGGRILFDYSAVAPTKNDDRDKSEKPQEGLTTSAAKAAALAAQPRVSTLEGAADDPIQTKVVDRRWYERNKHIYPASMWQEFDAEKDYATEIRRDTGGNAFFFSK